MNVCFARTELRPETPAAFLEMLSFTLVQTAATATVFVSLAVGQYSFIQHAASMTKALISEASRPRTQNWCGAGLPIGCTIIVPSVEPSGEHPGPK